MADSPYALRLSAASQWMRCAAYVSMNRNRPELEQDVTVREEGTAIHWAAYEIAHGRYIAEGTTAPNGVSLDDEMLDVVATYLDELRSAGVPVYMELPVHARRIHLLCGGTLDAATGVMSTADGYVIKLWDLKGGYSPVDVFRNPQLVGYGSGLLDTLGIDGYVEQSLTFEFNIVQPRVFNTPQRWRVRAVELRPMWNQMSAAAERALADSPIATAGGHCENCASRGVCESARFAAMHALDVSREAQVLELQPQELNYELLRIEQAIDILQARKTGLEAHAVQFIRAGQHLTNYGLEPGRSRLKWDETKPDEVERVKVAARMLGKEIVKPEQLITPTQAKTAFGKEFAALVDAAAVRPAPSLKLKRTSESKIAKAFSD